jgi:hypothetical protein
MHPSRAAQVIDAEAGHDVGDGQVRYNTPYDPKNTREVTFVSPTPAHPYYEIAVPLGDLSEGTQTEVHAVRINGVASDSYYMFVDGFARAHDLTVTRNGTKARNVVVVTRSVWHDAQPTTIEIDLAAFDKDGKPVRRTQSVRATAPSIGGVPAGWRRYQSVLLQEKAGLDRKDEPVEFSLTERAEWASDLGRELRVFRIDPDRRSLEPVKAQTFNAQNYAGAPPGTSQPWQDAPGRGSNYITHPTKSVEGVFPANVPAHGAVVYVLLYDNPSASPADQVETDLKITGKSLGATIENKFYTAWLHEQSGCISKIQLKPSGERRCPVLSNSLNHALHWNPDSFGDNGIWGHVFAWNPPERVVVAARGPLLYRITVSGRMPEYTPQIDASVSYSFYAGVPYVRVTTVMKVRDAMAASAIRNGELVVDTHLVDHFVWEEKNGQVRRIRTLHGPNFQDEWAERVDHDVHWLAMTSEADGYGLGVAVTDSLAFNPDQGEATNHRLAYYLYYHHNWSVPLTYFTRAWVYPFSDYQKGPNLPVSAGSTYVERMGIMPFYLHDGDDRYETITSAGARLRNPLSQRWGR